MGRRRFTREFKIEAVRRMGESDQSVSQVARDLGIGSGLLSRWRRAYETDALEAFPGQGRLKEQDEHLRRVERENRALRDEVAFLKKTAAYFARDSRSGLK
jgi:transposase